MGRRQAYLRRRGVKAAIFWVLVPLCGLMALGSYSDPESAPVVAAILLGFALWLGTMILLWGVAIYPETVVIRGEFRWRRVARSDIVAVTTTTVQEYGGTSSFMPAMVTSTDVVPLRPLRYGSWFESRYVKGAAMQELVADELGVPAVDERDRRMIRTLRGRGRRPLDRLT